MARILLVEDEMTVRFLLRYFLEYAQHTVLTAKSGREALEKLEHYDIDLLITGIVMPEMGGLALLRYLRTSACYRDLPVLILTGGTEKVRQQAMVEGADVVLEKPASVDVILQAINTLLDRCERVRSDVVKEGETMTNIMLVEDNMIMRSALRDLLRLQGYNVVTAMHGREALDRLDESPVDLLVTDFLMPEMDGLILLKNLRADARYQSLPVIMFTAHIDPEVQENVMAAGADDFLLRPITIDELVAAIQRALDI